MIPGVVASGRKNSDLPYITSAASVSVADGATLSHSLTSNVPCSFEITGGVDAAEFEISGSTLRWAGNGTQSFSSPADAGANNVYDVELTATSLETGEASDPQAIAVTVTNPWVTVVDATTGTVSSDLDMGGKNSRTIIDPASTPFGSSGYTKIRVTFKAGTSGALNIDNAAFGKNQGSISLDEFLNYSGTPTVLLFGGLPNKSIPAGQEFTSDEATLATPFLTSNALIVAINHGASSKICGRAESNCAIYSKTMAGDDSTNAAVTGDLGEYDGNGVHSAWGISKIELKP